MTIQQVVDNLQREKQENLPSRYPCRAIMVNNINQYSQLISELKKINDIRVVRTKEIFSSSDTMPKYENLKGDEYHNQWVILTGVSEYLRLFSKKEATDKNFYRLWTNQVPASSYGRIIIPLWDCEAQWNDPSINLNGDLRQQDYYFDCTDMYAPEQNMKVLILSGMFEQYESYMRSLHAKLLVGLREWFEYWENPSPEIVNLALITRRYNSITTTEGNISVNVIKDSLAFIRKNMPEGKILTTDNCSASMQDALFQYALTGISISDAILTILNMSSFSGLDVMRKWNSLTKSGKELIVLWFNIHPEHTYLCHCFRITRDIIDIPSTILHEIFKVHMDRPEWIPEFRDLISAMGIVPDPEFFSELSTIPIYESRLAFLTGNNKSERIYLLKMVGEWMRKDLNGVCVNASLKQIYPELVAYLNTNMDSFKDNAGEYISIYKSFKLSNTLPEDLDNYFSNVDPDKYESRYSVISEYIDDSTVVLWIDALGVEWFSLLYSTIVKNCDGTVKRIEITQATLPSETCFNDQWNRIDVPHVKRDKLDKLAHKGVIDEPDYYSCIQEQIEFVSGLHKYVTELMSKYHRVIITGDHGTSRLAARFFHAKDGITAPNGVKVHSHGRYCELQSEGVALPSNMKIVKGPNEIKYAVFQNYDHFKRSGFAAGGDDDNAIYGEIHGGAAPEEMLVPVVVIDSNKAIPLEGAWTSNTVKIFMRKAKFTITFNRPIRQLTVKIGGILGNAVNLVDGIKWEVTVPNIKANHYTAEVYADGCIVNMPEVIIKSALGGGEGDLP